MTKRCHPAPTIEEQWMASTPWVVCPDVIVPVFSVEKGEALAAMLDAEAPCRHRHEVVQLDLRPINWRKAYAWWRNHAFAYKKGGTECHGCLTLDDDTDEAQEVSAALQRTRKGAR